jgi:hypothetical protein
MKNVIVGQLAELVYKNDGENAWWEYAVVEHIFDDRIELKKESGGRYMHIIEANGNEKEIVDTQVTNSNITFLSQGGKPVLAKKKLFGGYKFKPSY